MAESANAMLLSVRRVYDVTRTAVDIDAYPNRYCFGVLNIPRRVRTTTIPPVHTDGKCLRALLLQKILVHLLACVSQLLTAWILNNGRPRISDGLSPRTWLNRALDSDRRPVASIDPVGRHLPVRIIAAKIFDAECVRRTVYALWSGHVVSCALPWPANLTPLNRILRHCDVRHQQGDQGNQRRYSKPQQPPMRRTDFHRNSHPA